MNWSHYRVTIENNKDFMVEAQCRTLSTTPSENPQANKKSLTKQTIISGFAVT